MCLGAEARKKPENNEDKDEAFLHSDALHDGPIIPANAQGSNKCPAYAQPARRSFARGHRFGSRILQHSKHAVGEMEWLLTGNSRATDVGILHSEHQVCTAANEDWRSLKPTEVNFDVVSRYFIRRMDP